MAIDGNTKLRLHKMYMNPMDTMNCFSDSQTLNNFVNNKVIETNQNVS